jgi:hypothetical protein
MALVHYPVVNKDGDVIASAVTNLDLHDMARAARTYGVRGYCVVTPLSDQQVLARRIIGHWTEGEGGRRHPMRREALSLIRVADNLGTAMDAIEKETGHPPKTVATCARRREGMLRYETFKRMIGDGGPHLLIFGTAWGLAPALLETVDYVLAPIEGPTDYNHLSVRSAASIILDRLMGDRADRH